jgi:hypothetical protein
MTLDGLRDGTVSFLVVRIEEFPPIPARWYHKRHINAFSVEHPQKSVNGVQWEERSNGIGVMSEAGTEMHVSVDNHFVFSLHLN